MAILNQEKAFDGVPQRANWWAILSPLLFIIVMEVLSLEFLGMTYMKMITYCWWKMTAVPWVEAQPWGEAHNSLPSKKGAPGDQLWDLLCMQLASYLEGGPLMCMMPLHLHFNKKNWEWWSLPTLVSSVINLQTVWTLVQPDKTSNLPLRNFVLQIGGVLELF